MSWEERAAAKRAALADAIPSEWRIPKGELPPKEQQDVTTFVEDSGFFQAREMELTALSAFDTLAKLRSGEWSSTDVTRAYCKKAAVAHQLTNCLTETLFDLALSTAAKADAHLAQHKSPIGPLHGLPISLKDNFQFPGVDSCLGFTAYTSQPSTSTTALVTLLISLGAVPYVKTAVPTAMMIAETVNNVFGRTLNPRNRILTSGGSSGGESALISFGGSCLGVGTDIGGSLRIPAACTGIFALKPSAGRFPTGGAKSGLAGQESVVSVNGPMARTLGDLEVFAKAVVGAEPWRVDPKCLPIPWREVKMDKKLRIGLVRSDGTVYPTPPVSRALHETVGKLKSAGHEIVEWDVTLHRPLMECLGQFFVADGGKTLRSILEPVGEPFRPEMQAYETATEMGVADLWKVQARRTQLATDYLKQWQDAGIDCLLSPTTPYATTGHTKFKYFGYTGPLNVLDYSALSFPCGINADEELDSEYGDEPVLSEYDQTGRDDYNAAAISGMPVSLQLIAGRLEEEKLLEIAKIVLKDLKL